MRVETISLIIGAFVSGSLGIASLVRNTRSQLCVSFFCLMTVFCLHDFFAILEGVESMGGLSNPKLHSLMTGLLIPSTFWVLSKILHLEKKKLAKHLFLSSLLIGIIILTLVFKNFDALSYSISLFLHFSFFCVALFWASSFRSAESESELTREKIRFRYAYLGALLTLGFYLTNIAQSFGMNVPGLGTIFRSIYLFFIFQTFIQRELLTLEELVTKGALFGGLSLMFSIIYALLVSWVGNQPFLFFFNTLIASFVVIVLFEPIKTLASRSVRKLLSKRNLLLETELNFLSSHLVGLVEPHEIAKKIEIFLQRFFGMKTADLFLLEKEGFSFVMMKGVPEEDLREVSNSNALIEYISLRRGRPFVFETIENDRAAFYSKNADKFHQNCLETMRKLKADFIIPLLHDAKLIGFFAAKSEERTAISNEQLRLFIPLSRQVALLLKNAQIFTSIRDRDKLSAIGEMAAGLAHEIKNPLGAIKGAAQLLKNENQGDRNNNEFLKIIIDESDRLSVVLSDFLDYAKPRKNYPESVCNPVNVIEHTAAMLPRDASMTFEIDAEDKKILLEADPEVLKQVLLNLFLNATQAMKGISEKGKLLVRVRQIKKRAIRALAESLPIQKIWESWDKKESALNNYLEISVEDNGVGMSYDEMSRIFIPFYTTKPKGTGLGLPICQRLVESLGGSIQVKSNQPRGTVFTLLLPIKRKESKQGDFYSSLFSQKTKDLQT